MQANDIHIKKKKKKATVPYIWKKQCSDTNVFSVLKTYIIKNVKEKICYSAKWIPKYIWNIKKGMYHSCDMINKNIYIYAFDF